MMSMNLSYIYILNIKNGSFCCIINRISKSEAIKVLQNIDLTEKSGALQKKVPRATFKAINLLEILIKKIEN